MPSRVLRGAAALTATVLTALGASALAVQPAAAQTRTFNDGGGYVTTVKVQHTTSKVFVDAKVGTITIGSDYTLWLDTKPSNPGPEYKVQVYPNSDGIALLKVDTFASHGTRKRCDVRATADAYGSDHVTVQVPTRCIGNPSRVRVAFRGYYAVPGPNVVDWAPAKNSFFGWVNRG